MFTPIVESTSAPADRFSLPDGTVFGIISSTTEPFCRDCDRSRLTADGMWYLCLYAERGSPKGEPRAVGSILDVGSSAAIVNACVNMTISCEVTTNQKRQLTIRFGRSFRFVIPECGALERTVVEELKKRQKKAQEGLLI